VYIFLRNVYPPDMKMNELYSEKYTKNC